MLPALLNPPDLVIDVLGNGITHQRRHNLHIIFPDFHVVLVAVAFPDIVLDPADIGLQIVQIFFDTGQSFQVLLRFRQFFQTGHDAICLHQHIMQTGLFQCLVPYNQQISLIIEILLEIQAELAGHDGGIDHILVSAVIVP